MSPIAYLFPLLAFLQYIGSNKNHRGQNRYEAQRTRLEDIFVCRVQQSSCL
jgi:hypothetical protein